MECETSAWKEQGVAGLPCLGGAVDAGSGSMYPQLGGQLDDLALQTSRCTCSQKTWQLVSRLENGGGVGTLDFTCKN